ncbi:hypothetical protein ACFU53_33560 [Streptomyces sp. NPDC057474]|uniref:hypothetical protein n=1 Tax=Streptomyces sp. NPDC057474 TaxID=3346144 RepID=UPI0036910ECC
MEFHASYDPTEDPTDRDMVFARAGVAGKPVASGITYKVNKARVRGGDTLIVTGKVTWPAGHGPVAGPRVFLRTYFDDGTSRPPPVARPASRGEGRSERTLPEVYEDAPWPCPPRRQDRQSRLPTCGVPLQGVTSVRSRGRYLCPIDGYVVTLGQTPVQLDRPMRLIRQPGECGRWRVTEPSQLDAQRLEHLAGRVLGTGCVVSVHYGPDRDRPTGWDGRAGLRLVDADATGEPAARLVNKRLTYRQCAACASRIPDLPERHVPTEWTPCRAWATTGRSQFR